MKKLTTMVVMVSVAALLVAGSARATSYSNHILGRGDVISYYPLDEPAGPVIPVDNAEGTAAYDGSLVANVARGTAGPRTADGWGGLGTANTHYNYTSNGSIQLTSALQTAINDSSMTFSMMIKLNSTNNQSRIFENGIGGNNHLMVQHWNVGGNRIIIGFNDTATSQFFGTNPLNDLQWHHLVVVRDGTDVHNDATVYLDGTSLAKTGTGGWGDRNSTTPNIASGADGTTQRLNAGIDEVAFFSTALSASEVTSLYYAAVVPEPATMALLVLGSLVLLRRRKSA